jgi:hypothetical protein
MKNEKGIVEKFKTWSGNTKNIDKLKAKLTKFGYTEEEITGFETQANGE